MTFTEAEIVEGCKAGKRELQKALYTRFSGKMFAVCLRYCKSREEAEDVLQDGFVKVFHNIQQFMGTGSFEGWIRRIMVNTALEALRKKKLDFSSIDISYVGNQQDLVFDPANKLSAQELLNMIQGLPSGYRTIFNLYAIEGYQHNEIAVMLGISEGTSKSQLARARNMLQERLKKTEIIQNQIN